MKVPIEVGDIIHIRESAGKRYTGYGVVTETIATSDLVSYKRLVDRYGLLVNVGTKKAASITINRCYCSVLDQSAIHKVHEEAVSLADRIREHLLSNRRR